MAIAVLELEGRCVSLSLRVAVTETHISRSSVPVFTLRTLAIEDGCMTNIIFFDKL